MENQIIKEKMSLSDILTTFNQMDEGIISLSEKEMEELGRKIHLKVDGYKDFLDRCDTEIQHMKARAAKFAEAAKQIENTRNRLEKAMIFHLKNNDVQKVAGDHFKVAYVQIKNNKVEQKEKIDPSLQHFVKIPDLIKRKFSWNLTEIKKELKKEDPDPIVSELFTLSNTDKLQWTINKGI